MDPKTNAESISSSVEEEKEVTKEVKEIEKKLKNGEEIVLGSKVDENDDMESLALSQCLVSRNEDGFTILPFADTYLFLSPTFSNNEIEAEHTFFVGESRITHLGKKSGNNEWKIEYKGQNKDPIKIKEEVKTIYIGRDSYKNNFAIPCTLRLSLIHISEPTRPLYISYAVFCLKKKKISNIYTIQTTITTKTIDIQQRKKLN
eukprot:TRINITY_DN5927_c0_g1_i1.p2 TRINITY_DN5927_c0_g1~~TRINITY_DN5927_c0_g1_i1.p2  ORF type:complete len:203 (-),score=39.98 TRINITY_DN5927_c0_g1_i1:26-634(-)